MVQTPIAPDVFARRTGLTAEDLQILRGTDLFSGMEEDSIRTSLADSFVQRFSRDTPLFYHGEAATRFFIVMSGWVKIFRDTADGHESVIGVFTKGDSFAEAAVAKLGSYPANAMVVDEARLLAIPGDRFMRHVREDTGLAMNLMASMSNRMKGLVKQVEQLSARSSAERLAGFLIQLCDDGEGEATIRLPLDKALIAARLGMQPETFSRSLAKLRKVGVQTKGSTIHIESIRTLKEFSSGM